jgi:hypothetical protein
MKRFYMGALLASIVLAGAGWVTMQNDDYWFPGNVSVQKSIDIKEAAGLKIESTAVTSSAAELNILDGCTATYAQLNAAASGNIAVARITNALGSAGSYIAGNIPVASLTNAITATTGIYITNTCVAADGKTNTYVFAPIGGRYVVHSISTSP